MKKMLVVILALLLIVLTAACTAKSGGSTTETENEPKKTGQATEAVDRPVDGGWADASSIAVSDEVKAMFGKLNGTLAGAQYEPIVYLQSQVVGGFNHLVLCKMTATVPDTATNYALVTVYEDPDGNAEITETQESSAVAPEPYDPENPIAGGYGEPESFALTDEAKTALAKANEAESDTSYEPVALLGTQIVAGTNYMLLCRATEKNNHAYYTILTVYADLDGNAEITANDGFAVDDAVNTDDNPDGVIDAASSQAE